MFNNRGPNGIPVSGVGGGGGRGEFWWWVAAAPPSRTTVALTALAGIAVFAALFYTTSRGHIKSPWSHRKKTGTLSPEEWRSLFSADGRLKDGGVTFLKKVRSGGVDTSIRAEVWPFLLGVYDLNSTKEERQVISTKKRKEYEKLRKQCQWLLRRDNDSLKLNEPHGAKNDTDSGSLVQDTDSSNYEDVITTEVSAINVVKNLDVEYSDDSSSTLVEGDKGSRQVVLGDGSVLNSESSDSDLSEDPAVIQGASTPEGREENDFNMQLKESASSSRPDIRLNASTCENFATWQRIIRVDAIRANAEWVPFSPSQTAVSESRARNAAEAVGLKDYDHLEPCRIFHAARLVAILEAYALYDPEIGYCQGMSDLLSPVIAVITEDYEAFWCFVGFMKKARHNFRLDEVGIRRQLNIVAKIIKFKDSCLYRHLEMLQAEDCFFVYRMVVVLFRRELTFEQTICLWEVIWADQATIRSGIGKSEWSRIRQRAPPTDDLLLYAIAASVLQRRKLIIEKYSSMDEILRECNSMAGKLDVWKLLDDAHGLVVNLHDKIETSFE